MFWYLEMQLNNVKLTILMFLLIVCQLAINNLTIIYVDCLGVLLAILLAYNSFSIRAIILLSIISDLIGHWYIGSHLFASVLVSVVTGYCTNFYKMSNFLQRYILVAIFYVIFKGILILLDKLLGNSVSIAYSYPVEIGIILPVTFIIFSRYIIRPSSDIIV